MCDRCGSFFIERKIGIYEVSGREMGLIDLCPNCQDKLDKFMLNDGGDEIAKKDV